MKPISIFIACCVLSASCHEIPVANEWATSIHPYIMMGSNVDIGRYPWYSVMYIETDSGGTVMCGSVLITPRDVLTAAHCVSDARYIRLGFHLEKDPDDPWGYMPGFNVLGDQISIHPEYNRFNFYGDIAIVHLPRDLQEVMPVVLSGNMSEWESKDYNMNVIGHGVTEDATLSPDLRMVDLPVVPYDECVSYSPSSSNTWLPMHVHSDLCAGYTNGCDREYCEDACHGDSGGPIFDPYTEVVYGLVSRGESPCGKSQRPAMFASTSSYRHFIDSRSEGEVKWDSRDTDLIEYPTDDDSSSPLAFCFIVLLFFM